MIKILETDFKAFALNEGLKVLGWCPLINGTQAITRVKGTRAKEKCKLWLEARPEIRFFDAYRLEVTGIQDNITMIEIFL